MAKCKLYRTWICFLDALPGEEEELQLRVVVPSVLDAVPVGFCHIRCCSRYFDFLLMVLV